MTIAHFIQSGQVGAGNRPAEIGAAGYAAAVSAGFSLYALSVIGLYIIGSPGQRMPVAGFDVILPELLSPGGVIATFAFALLGSYSSAGHLMKAPQGRALGGLALLGGVLSGIGGGLVRDLVVIQNTPVCIVYPAFIIAALLGAVIGLALASKQSNFRILTLETMDNIATGFTVVNAVEAAFEITHGGQPDAWGLTAFSIATLTACGGGVLRDLLLRRAVAAFQGSTLFVIAAGVSLNLLLVCKLGVVTSATLWPGMVAVTVLIALTTRNIRLPNA